MSAGPSCAVVIPTIGRHSLSVLLDSLADSATATGRALPPVVLVDDRPDPAAELAVADRHAAGWSITVLRSGGRGPAAARLPPATPAGDAATANGWPSSTTTCWSARTGWPSWRRI
ncbi:MAG: hypothetical protein ABI047_15505 [Jatrophihabitantaceae bacterium]